MTVILPYKKVTVSLDSYSIEFMFLVNPSNWIPTIIPPVYPFCVVITPLFLSHSHANKF